MKQIILCFSLLLLICRAEARECFNVFNDRIQPTEDSVLVVDTQLLGALVSTRGKLSDLGAQAQYQLLSAFHLRVNLLKNPLYTVDRVLSELAPHIVYHGGSSIGNIQVLHPIKNRQQAEYDKLVSHLEELGVGGKKGKSDRSIVADVFFLEVPQGVTPTLITADAGIYNRLLRMPHVITDTLSYEVTYTEMGGQIRKIRLVPISIN